MLDSKDILQKMIDRGFTGDEVALVAASLSVDCCQGNEKLLAQRAKNRERQRRFRAAKKCNVSVTLHNVTSEKHEQNQQPSNVSVTLPTNEGIYIEEMDVKSMYVKEKEVKEEATNVEVKEVPLNQVPVEQVPVSRARARKKSSGTEIPLDWPPSELTQIGLNFGFSLEETQSELAAMQDWAISKDERRVNWTAFARNWLRTAKKKQQSHANGWHKPQQISPRLQVILNNERLFHEAAARGSQQQFTDNNCFEATELRSLGEPIAEAIPKNRNSGYG